MSHRPDAKLPYSATFVIWASRPDRGGLTFGEKVVWFHSWALDQDGPDGCYMSDKSMGDRIGLEERTIREFRYRLRKLGLLKSFIREEGEQIGWVSVLPTECRPTSPRAAGAQAFELATKLDLHICARAPDRNHHCQPAATAIAKHPKVQAAVLGGKGGDPTSVPQSEAQLLPAVKATEDGVGAKAPKARKDEEQLGMPALNLQVVEGNQPKESGPNSPEWQAQKARAWMPQHGRREETA